MKRFAQIAAVAGALSMLVGFVVYSQQKAGPPDGYFKSAPSGTGTNAATRAAPTPAVAPSSKLKAPLLSPPATVSSTNKIHPSSTPPAEPAVPVSDIVAGGSKSIRVIKPEQLSPRNPGQVQVVESGPPAQRSVPTGQVMVGTKSAAVFTPSSFANPQSLAMATNPPARKPAP